MSVTTTGAEFKAFYADPSVWGTKDGADSWYVDDLVIVVNGNAVDMDAVYTEHGDSFERLPDDAKVKIECGLLIWQGAGSSPKPERSIVPEFKKWAKARQVVSVTASFELPKTWSAAQLGKLVNVLEALGAKPVAGATGGDLDAQEKQALERVLGQIIGVDLPSALQAPSAERKRSPSPR